MSIDVQDSYFESRILNADGVQLVQIMYQAAIDAAELARQCLRQGDIAARSRAISKAHEIITELEVSLNHEAGGEVSRNLAETYCYLRGRLLAANLEQSDAPLEEVARLLRIIQEAWMACTETVPARPDHLAAPAMDFEPMPEPEPVSDEQYGWSGYSGGYAPSYPPPAEAHEYHVSVSY
ncbi:flagellar export chaperone FliS [Paludibaculum fermentans]|uniref:Flagellar export chaperone FliS n=1 Tax=Paludibaculum fermentans TaxID=1473598 RepID=A0A7S7NKW9_PALFE|nr:flagellar export chaperone FliS [Paludibaculum fermentans]QOY85526.1 flagellar export chaperone FliS [Paludibaculum fermentans]